MEKTRRQDFNSDVERLSGERYVNMWKSVPWTSFPLLDFSGHRTLGPPVKQELNILWETPTRLQLVVPNRLLSSGTSIVTTKDNNKKRSATSISKQPQPNL